MKFEELDFDVIDWHEDDEINMTQKLEEAAAVLGETKIFPAADIEMAADIETVADIEGAEDIEPATDKEIADIVAEYELDDDGDYYFEEDQGATAVITPYSTADIDAFFEDGDLTEEEIAELGGLEYQDDLKPSRKAAAAEVTENVAAAASVVGASKAAARTSGSGKEAVKQAGKKESVKKEVANKETARKETAKKEAVKKETAKKAAPAKEEDSAKDKTAAKPVVPVSKETVKADMDAVKVKSKKTKTKKDKKRDKSDEDDEEAGGFRFSFMDAVIALAGILIVVMCVFVFFFWDKENTRITDLGEFATVGAALSEIDSIGKNGINRVVSSAASDIEGMDVVTTPDGEEIMISVSFTSLEKDLKIKFINQYTEKLIEGTKFSMEAVAPNNDVLEWTDEDADGVIYLEDLAAGSYMVTLRAVDGYTFPEEPTKVIVKDKIVYTAINILNEVKDEKDINASKEDGDGKGGVDEETKLQDTVEWVESSKTCISGADGYAPVDKSKIPDPATLASSGSRNSSNAAGDATVMETVDKGTAEYTVQVGESVQLFPNSPEDATKYTLPYTYSWTASGDAGKTTIADDTKTMMVEGLKAGTMEVTCKVTKTLIDSTETDEDVYKYKVVVKEKEAAAVITDIELSSSSLELKVGQEAALTATAKGTGDFDKQIFPKVENESICQYADGKVKALAVGETQIVFTSFATNAEGKVITKTCKVKVLSAEGLKLTVAENKATIGVGETYQIKATVTNYAKDKGVTYKSADEKIAKVDANGLVTGVAKGGPVKITVTTNEKGKDGKQLTATVEITIKANPKTDKKSALKDSSGNQVYIKGSDGKYTAATWADYYTATAFYIEAEPVYKYTGWQTLNGKTYFFDKNGNKVTGEQVILGVKYNFDSNGALSMNGGVLGIDVSKYQTEIDWKAVKNSGISFVIIRCGYRGYSTGVLVKDPLFETHIKGATSAGLKVGLYFFSQAINEKEAVEEASMAIALAKKYTISYPIFIDTEQVSGGRADGLDAAKRTAICKAFCETIKDAGYTSGVYACKSWYESKLNAGSLEAYKIWLAQYASVPTYSGKYDMWQYTEKGKVSGVTGNVDVNISYLGY